MKHHIEKSSQANEKPAHEMGDAIAGKRDLSAEQRAAFQHVGKIDQRVAHSESNQGRTK